MDRGWAVFDGFTRPVEERSWDVLEDWAKAIDSLLEPSRRRVEVLRRQWHATLAALGGEPTCRDWTKFRPLQPGREEDWSDWLAELIRNSETGQFATALLAGGGQAARPEDHIARDVLREVPHEGRRADLLILWQLDDSYTHVEVKVGDQELSKTLDTATKMERLQAHTRCRRDLVLLLPEQVEQWRLDCEMKPALGQRVGVLTWADVSRALRRALRDATGEPLFWQAWAYAFCALIEQQLLAMPCGPLSTDWIRGLDLDQLRRAEALLDLDGGA